MSCRAGSRIAQRPAEPAISLTLERDRAVPRLKIVLTGRVNGNKVADAFIRLYAEEPAALLFDRLFAATALFALAPLLTPAS